MRTRLGRGKTERGRGLHWAESRNMLLAGKLPTCRNSVAGQPATATPATNRLLWTPFDNRLHSYTATLLISIHMPPISIFRITSQSSGEGQSVVYNPIPRQREITVVNSISRFGTSIALESTEDRGKMIYSRI
ncbi:hypothetical protein LXL04_034584 [Taraxacum kok-saghyz]